jgi:hypothetical protein
MSPCAETIDRVASLLVNMLHGLADTDGERVVLYGLLAELAVVSPEVIALLSVGPPFFFFTS